MQIRFHRKDGKNAKEDFGFEPCEWRQHIALDELVVECNRHSLIWISEDQRQSVFPRIFRFFSLTFNGP